MDGWYAGNARSNFLSNLTFYNAGDERLSSCPSGAQTGSQRCVAYTDVGKGRELGAEALQLLLR